MQVPWEAVAAKMEKDIQVETAKMQVRNDRLGPWRVSGANMQVRENFRSRMIDLPLPKMQTKVRVALDESDWDNWLSSLSRGSHVHDRLRLRVSVPKIQKKVGVALAGDDSSLYTALDAIRLEVNGGGGGGAARPSVNNDKLTDDDEMEEVD